jgi:hypothetical protein
MASVQCTARSLLQPPGQQGFNPPPHRHRSLLIRTSSLQIDGTGNRKGPWASWRGVVCEPCAPDVDDRWSFQKLRIVINHHPSWAGVNPESVNPLSRRRKARGLARPGEEDPASRKSICIPSSSRSRARSRLHVPSRAAAADVSCGTPYLAVGQTAISGPRLSCLLLHITGSACGEIPCRPAMADLLLVYCTYRPCTRVGSVHVRPCTYSVRQRRKSRESQRGVVGHRP